MIYRTPYDGSRFKVMLSFEGTESRTKQSFKDECDINNIMRRFHQTGLIAHVNKYSGSYEDVGSGLDYRESMHLMMRAQEAFRSLPAKLRARFGNDPGEFLMFVSDPANADEMVKLGLRKASAQAGAQPAPESTLDKQPAASDNSTA